MTHPLRATAQDEKRDWLIWEGRSECWWGRDSGGYWKSLEYAGLYTEKEAKEIEAASVRTRDRKDEAVHVTALPGFARMVALFSPYAEAALADVQRATREWQPIETAPKDGTPILILALDDERFVGCWKRGGWELFGAYVRIDPTRAWMPLPAPPVAAAIRQEPT